MVPARCVLPQLPSRFWRGGRWRVWTKPSLGSRVNRIKGNVSQLGLTSSEQLESSRTQRYLGAPHSLASSGTERPLKQGPFRAATLKLGWVCHPGNPFKMACLGPQLCEGVASGQGVERPSDEAPGRTEAGGGPSLRSRNKELQDRGPGTQQLAALPSEIRFFLPKIHDVLQTNF